MKRQYRISLLIAILAITGCKTQPSSLLQPDYGYTGFARASVVDESSPLYFAERALLAGEPQQSLRHLAQIPRSADLPYGQQQIYYQLLAESYQRTGHPIESIQARQQLARFLPRETVRLNEDMIWRTILTLDKAQLHMLILELAPSSLHAWAQLAFIVKQYPVNSRAYLQAVAQWQAQYPQHPGEAYLSTSWSDSAARQSAPAKKIALLLPLSGSLAVAGETVREGFMAAYYESSRAQVNRPQIQVYDTAAADRSINSIYDHALAEGAEVVVGPIAQEQVEQLARRHYLAVPTLALNFVKRSAAFYQFGISLQTEAAMVAHKAQQSGARRALILSPKSELGERLAQIFSEQWRALGGIQVGHLHYDVNKGLDKAVQALLHLNASEQRVRELRKQLANNKIKAQPRRRQDIDMIFLVANPAQGRQIRPLLKFYYAGDIPVYSSSMIYSGLPNATEDFDLEGIIFCDTPWIFDDKNLPEFLQQQGRDTRLYALGMDAYALAQQLDALGSLGSGRGAVPVPGRSGLLTVDEQGKVARPLGWAQFRQGQPKLMEAM